MSEGNCPPGGGNLSYTWLSIRATYECVTNERCVVLEVDLGGNAALQRRACMFALRRCVAAFASCILLLYRPAPPSTN